MQIVAELLPYFKYVDPFIAADFLLHFQICNKKTERHDMVLNDDIAKNIHTDIGTGSIVAAIP